MEILGEFGVSDYLFPIFILTLGVVQLIHIGITDFSVKVLVIEIILALMLLTGSYLEARKKLSKDKD